MECRVQMIAWHSRTNGQPWKKRVNAILHREIRSSDCTNVRHILPHIFCNQFYFLHSPMLVIPIPTNCSFRVHHFPSSTFFPINFRIHFHLPYCIVRIISKFRIGSLVGSTSNSSMTTEVTFLFESADSAFTAFMIFPWSETREERERNEKMKNYSIKLKTSVFLNIPSRQRIIELWGSFCCQFIGLLSVERWWLNYTNDIEFFWLRNSYTSCRVSCFVLFD